MVALGSNRASNGISGDRHKRVTDVVRDYDARIVSGGQLCRLVASINRLRVEAITRNYGGNLVFASIIRRCEDHRAPREPRIIVTVQIEDVRTRPFLYDARQNTLLDERQRELSIDRSHIGTETEGKP